MNADVNALPKLSAPAQRALAGAGIRNLQDLARLTESEILALHGMGPKAMGILHGAMRAHGLNFKQHP